MLRVLNQDELVEFKTGDTQRSLYELVKEPQLAAHIFCQIENDYIPKKLTEMFKTCDTSIVRRTLPITYTLRFPGKGGRTKL